jgi:hypothetical protein
MMESTVSDRSARWRGLLARQISSGLSVAAFCRREVCVTHVTTSHGEAEMAKVSEDGIFDLGVGRQRQDGFGGVYRFSGVSPRRGGWDGPSALLV